MDFEKLKLGDKAAWTQAHGSLHAIGYSSAQDVGNEVLNTGEISDIADEAIGIAVRKIQKITSELHLRGFVFEAAWNLANDAVKKAKTKKRGEGKKESLEAKIEAVGDFKELDTGVQPDELLKKAELIANFNMWWAQFPPEDQQLLWNRFVEEMLEKDIASLHGWSTESTHNRITQACKRVRDMLLSDENARTLLNELGWEHYFDE